MSNKLILTCLSCFLIHFNALAQPLEFGWGHQVSGSGFKSARAFEKDAANYLYAAGDFSGTANFDPQSSSFIRTASSSNNGFIYSLDSNGTFRWLALIRGTGTSVVYDIALGADQMLYATGTFSGTIDLDPDSFAVQSVTSKGGNDIFFLKFDRNGKLIWARTYGSTTSDYGMRIHFSPTNHVLFGGIFNDSIVWSGGTSPVASYSSGGSDVYLVKSDTAGNIVWAKTFAPSNSAYIRDIATSDLGDIYFTGGFRGTMDMDPDANTDSILSSRVNDTHYFGALDDSGHFLFCFTLYGDTYSVTGGWNILFENQSIYLGGTCKSWIDFDPGPAFDTARASGGLNGDFFIARYTKMGALLGYGVIGGNNADLLIDICSDATGSIYGVGSIVDTVDMDPGQGVYKLNSTGSMGISGYVFKWDSSLNFKWARTIPSSNYSSVYGIESDAKENLYLYTQFRGQGEFDPSADTVYYSAGGTDILIAKWDQCQTYIRQDTVSACALYTWHGMVLDSSGNYLDTLLTTRGCDSIVSLTLTIYPTHFTASLSECDSFFWNGRWLTQSGNYTDTLISSHACDSIVALQLTLSNSKITQNQYTACDSISFQGTWYHQSQTLSDTFPVSVGCDSIVITQLLVNHATSGTVNIGSCDSFIFKGISYSQSQTLYDTLGNASGCDSVVSIQLSIHSSSLQVENQVVCRSFLWRSQTLVNSGVYYDSLYGAQGCDSIFQLNLQIEDLSDSIYPIQNGLEALETGIAYQWLDCSNSFAPLANGQSRSFMPLLSGTYAVELKGQACQDTSICLSFTRVGINGSKAPVPVAIYPNPGKGEIHFSLPLDASYTLHVYSSRGVPVLRDVKLHTNSLSLPGDIPAGLYFIVVEREEGVAWRLPYVKMD